MQKQSKITSKGQITVPIEVRRSWAFEQATACFSRATATAYISGRSQRQGKRIRQIRGHRQSRHPSGKKPSIGGCAKCAATTTDVDGHRPALTCGIDLK